MQSNSTDDRQLWQSQNFLRRPEFVTLLLGKADITGSDLVIEIGPGTGIITQALSRQAGRVIAIELEGGLASNLRSRFPQNSNVEIIEADFLKWSLPTQPFKIFSNIPFNQTADIVKRLTANPSSLRSAYLIMQDKAAARFMGKPKESQASILLKPWFQIEIVTHIDRKEFDPVPKINAVLVKFEKLQKPLVPPVSAQSYRDFVVYGFNQWQPTILDAFKDVFNKEQRNFLEKEAGVGRAKPSDLSLSQWLKLFEAYQSQVAPEKKKIVTGAEQRLQKQQQKLTKWHRTRNN